MPRRPIRCRLAAPGWVVARIRAAICSTSWMPRGRVLVGYAEGCTLQCSTAPEAKSDAANGYCTKLATIARQSTGKRLFETR